MSTTKIQNEGQATIFKNKHLEALSRSHPAFIFAIYLPLITYLVYFSGHSVGFTWGRVALIFFSGLLSWTVFEYFAHRFIFHTNIQHRVAQRIAYVLHGNHHEFPRDKRRIIMPVAPSILLASSIFGAMYLIGGQYAFAFFPGFMFGYLSYSALHYAIHAMAPPFKWMKPLWRNHHLHHYQDEHHGYGVSSLLWDNVFDTAFDLKNFKVERKKTDDLSMG